MEFTFAARISAQILLPNGATLGLPDVRLTQAGGEHEHGARDSVPNRCRGSP
jgi:hypothetical protein